MQEEHGKRLTVRFYFGYKYVILVPMCQCVLIKASQYQERNFMESKVGGMDPGKEVSVIYGYI